MIGNDDRCSLQLKILPCEPVITCVTIFLIMTKQTTHATADSIPRTPVLVSWSSGKDSAWTFHTLRQQGERYDVRGIFTTVTKTFDRVSPSTLHPLGF